jgi:hypothetical protein
MSIESCGLAYDATGADVDHNSVPATPDGLTSAINR